MWAAGTVIATLFGGLILGFGNTSSSPSFGTAGITDLTGLSIAGSPGTLSVAGTTTFATTTQGGVTTITLRQAIVSGTTTPCSLPVAIASSTIQSWAVNFTSATSSLLNWSVGTSTTQYATTSGMISSQSIAANAQGQITWDAGVNNAGVGLASFIVLGTTVGSPAAAFSSGNGPVVAGSCQGTYQSYN